MNSKDYIGLSHFSLRFQLTTFKMSICFFLLITLCLIWSNLTFASDARVLKVYHDSDWANNIESSEAIWRGMELALSEVDYTVNGTRIELVKKSHNGNVTRSLRNMKAFLADKEAIAVFSGMHSPPLITNRAFINENYIPLLVPWAAGGPITRYPSSENSIFRLSVDDTKAGDVLLEHGVDEHKCYNPYLLVENTPWGDSNIKSIKAALTKIGRSPAGTKRFGWGLQSHVARSIILDVVREGAGCVFLISSANEGAHISIAMSELPEEERLPILSHWGVTGGNFHEAVPFAVRNMIDLAFIQTCFSFMQEPMSPKAKNVFEGLQKLYPQDIKARKDVSPPAGYIHGYDLTQLFIAALGQIELTDDMTTNRKLLRKSLESIDGPVQGLIKTYRKPFAEFSEDNFDAHEALGRDNICMGRYGPNNEIIVHGSVGKL
jgi:branched-chain amino acid transport system substrate-binding protein